MSPIGYMRMPDDFRYREIAVRGRPQHRRFDDFSIKHPRMDTGHRAKIFAPFDALTGFSDAVASKRTVYSERVMQGPEEILETDRRLAVLSGLVRNSREAAANRVEISVTYFRICDNENDLAFGIKGRYLTARGICRRIDRETGQYIQVDDRKIPLDDVIGIESESGIFGNTGEEICVPDSI